MNEMIRIGVRCDSGIELPDVRDESLIPVCQLRPSETIEIWISVLIILKGSRWAQSNPI